MPHQCCQRVDSWWWRTRRLDRQLLLIFFFASTGSAVATQAVVPYQMHDDFGGDGLSQWASYPPAQDIGYDPSLSPTEEYRANGNRSLMRVFRPPSTSRQRFGFIKKLDMVSTSSVKLSFSYRLMPAVAGSRIDIILAGGDGRPYVTSLRPAQVNAWTSSAIRFPTLPPGIPLEAIAIVAVLERADTDTDYRFLIDDVMLDASRPADFRVTRPATVAISPWRSLVSASTYSPGEQIVVDATSPLPLQAAGWELQDQDGRTVAQGSLQQHDGVWTGAPIYAVKTTDPTGVWHARIHGSLADGRTLETDLRLLIRPKRISAHPRLYFDANARSAFQDRMRRPQSSPAWDALDAVAKNSRLSGDLAAATRAFQLLDPRYLLPTLPSYFDFVNRASRRIQANSIMGLLAGDTQARDAAKSAVLEVAAWNAWVPPWFEQHGQHTYYPAGELTTDVALAYDLLYDDFSEAERRTVQAAILERGVHAAYREYVLDNRLMAGTSNWLGHTVGGAVVGALAIAGEDEDPRLNTYLGGLLMKLEDHLAASYLPDGSYGEGISYQSFDFQTTGLALSALQRVYGIDYWSRTFVKGSLTYPTYTLARPIHDSLDMGDSHGPSATTLAPMLQHSSTAAAHWYFDQFEHRSVADVLFPIAPYSGAAPPQPLSHVFDQKGNVVFRTGWGPEDAVFLFRAGPNFNHNHADQGSFLLNALGEPLAVEAGYSDYYKDPYYATYFSQAAGHNTVLVDEDPASQEIADTRQYAALHSYPRIVDAVASGSYGALGSELSSVYKGKLKRFTRRIVFLEGRYLVVYDDLAVDATPVNLDWLLHVNDRESVRVDGGTAVYSGAKAALDIRPLEPARVNIQVHDGHLPYAVFATTAPKTLPAKPGIVNVSASSPSVATQFLVLLGVGRTAEEARKLTNEARKISGDGCVGVQLGNDVVLFHRGAGSVSHYEDWNTDAAAWTSTSAITSGEMVTSLVKAGRIVMKSNKPVSFAARRSNDSVSLEVDAADPATLQFFTGFRPSNFHGSYREGDGTVSFEVVKGRHNLTLTR